MAFPTPKVQLPVTIAHREDFVNTWLFESPKRVLGPSFNSLDSIIREKIQYGLKVEHLTNHLYKMEGPENLYYWYETKKGAVVVAAELYKKPQALVVSMIAKNLLHKIPL